MGLVQKTSKDNVNRSNITEKARQRYFGATGGQEQPAESEERV